MARADEPVERALYEGHDESCCLSGHPNSPKHRLHEPCRPHCTCEQEAPAERSGWEDHEPDQPDTAALDRAQVAALTKERDQARILWDKYAVQAMDHLQRAEKAEAERDELRAKVGAVRALCDYHKHDGKVPLFRLRGALDGSPE